MCIYLLYRLDGRRIIGIPLLFIEESGSIEVISNAKNRAHHYDNQIFRFSSFVLCMLEPNYSLVYWPTLDRLDWRRSSRIHKLLAEISSNGDESMQKPWAFCWRELKERFRTTGTRMCPYGSRNLRNKLESFNCRLTVSKSQQKVSKKSAISQQKVSNKSAKSQQNEKSANIQQLLR